MWFMMNEKDEALYVKACVIPANEEDSQGDTLSSEDIKRIFTSYNNSSNFEIYHHGEKVEGISTLENYINKAEKTAEEILKYPVRFGNLKTANIIKPDASGAYGIVKYVSNIKHSKNIGSKIQMIEEQSFLKNMAQSFKSLFKSKSKNR